MRGAPQDSLECDAPSVSVIVPIWDEAPGLIRALGALRPEDCELIVSDAGSARETLVEALRVGARTVHGGRGRAEQMNRGRWLARGRYLLFLHADTSLPSGAIARICEVMHDPDVVGGCFALSIFPESGRLRLTARIANWRSRFLRMPYGDQAIFCRREDFDRLGGFRDIPIMEDLDLVDRLRGAGHFIFLKERAATSARRWQANGWLRTSLVHLFAACSFRLGSRPETIRRRYERWLPRGRGKSCKGGDPESRG